MNSPLLVVMLCCTAIADGANLHPSFGHGSHKQEGRHSKWIVVTTVNHPTETIQRLAAVPGWRLVVVADLKTPVDWELPNVELLTVERQKTLNYKILPLIPNNHYGRKNLGYLWAIQHGATLVYETDDDNVLRLPEPVLMDDMEFYVYNTSGSVCNPYQHFGQPHIWPRGYPLDQIHAQECSAFSRQPVKPLILQGMADLDPDVDAIYRLTQKLGVNFETDVASVALPEGVMCPWNSQNTLFEREALWGMLIPVTTTFRVCDIWRSYWVQRVLWEVGGRLAFGAPTVEQYRNVHTLLRDFNDELDLYNLTGHLIELLNKWQPPAGADLPRMMVDLGQVLADAKMWAQGDADLMAAWVADLQAIGYAFPPVRGQAPSGKPLQPPVALPRTPQTWQRHRGIVLVVTTSGGSPGALELLRAAYRPLFGKLVFTGASERPVGLPASEAWVGCQAGAQGQMHYACLANVMQEVAAPGGGGYLMVGDDAVFSPCQIGRMNANRVWFQREVAAAQGDLTAWLDAGGDMAAEGGALGAPHSKWHFSQDDVEKVSTVLDTFRKGGLKSALGERAEQKLGSKLHFGGENGVGLYVPARLATDFQVAAVPFRQQQVHQEVALPTILGLITDRADDFDVFTALTSPANKARDPMKGLAERMGTAFIMHPYSFDEDLAVENFWSWWQASACT